MEKKNEVKKMLRGENEGENMMRGEEGSEEYEGVIKKKKKDKTEENRR